MFTNTISQIHYLLIGIAIATGLALLFDPGMSFVIVAVSLLFTLVMLFVRDQHMRYSKQCLQPVFVRRWPQLKEKE